MGKHGTPPGGRKGPDGADYEVGYGKPPKKSQFAKGESGNPTGRPKTVSSEKVTLNRLLTKKYRVNTPEGVAEVDGQELVLTSLFQGTIKGKAPMAKLCWAGSTPRVSAATIRAKICRRRTPSFLRKCSGTWTAM